MLNLYGVGGNVLNIVVHDMDLNITDSTSKPNYKELEIKDFNTEDTNTLVTLLTKIDIDDLVSALFEKYSESEIDTIFSRYDDDINFDDLDFEELSEYCLNNLSLNDILKFIFDDEQYLHILINELLNKHKQLLIDRVFEECSTEELEERLKMKKLIDKST